MVRNTYEELTNKIIESQPIRGIILRDVKVPNIGIIKQGTRVTILRKYAGLLVQKEFCDCCGLQPSFVIQPMDIKLYNF